MYFKSMFSLVIILLLFSCGNAPQGPIELDNGQKWKVNAEMMPPLEASQQLISTFATSDKKDYKVLAAQLKANNQSLIESCTMSGKSHDELHKWLHPYMALVNDLGDAKDEKEASQTFEKIEQSFKTFNQYFQ